MLAFFWNVASELNPNYLKMIFCLAGDVGSWIEIAVDLWQIADHPPLRDSHDICRAFQAYLSMFVLWILFIL